MSFTTALREPTFAARAIFEENDTRALARELLMMEPDDYAATFRRSAIKRAKLFMLKRNAAVVLGNVGTDDDLPTLQAISSDDYAVVGETTRWAIRRIGTA